MIDIAFGIKWQFELGNMIEINSVSGRNVSFPVEGRERLRIRFAVQENRHDPLTLRLPS